MDPHALGRVGTPLHRAHATLDATDAVQELASDRAQTVVGSGLGEARELVGQARAHVLVVYALAHLRIGLPQNRPARIHDAYTALASAADELGVTTGASPPSRSPSARALTYRAGQRVSAPGGQAATRASLLSATTRSACSLRLWAA
ncbi:hypothetical protein [Streptomyces sp. I05A-00742]|uniref:hypothetical protein n=1 Tax=Streptomyces sp. I05A-00742 TaxID=2732853 RepID=UPI0014889E54|nr:hypothetical protein [Streptomyces sp. I05A-00742]